MIRRLSPLKHGGDRGPVSVGLEAGMPLLIVKDGAEHLWHKTLVTKVFTPKKMAALEPFIRKRTRELLDAAAKTPDFDFVKQFSVILPLDVISELLDIPEDFREEYHHCVNVGLSRDSDVDASTAMEANQRLIGFFLEQVKLRRSKPRDDVITLLMQSEVKDESGAMRKLDDMEIAFRFHEMGAAGHETAAKAIANGAMAFCRFPEQRELLRRQPRLLGYAVQEILRLEPPSQLQGRTTSVDVTLHGVTIGSTQMQAMRRIGAALRTSDIELKTPIPRSFELICRQISLQSVPERFMQGPLVASSASWWLCHPFSQLPRL